MVKLHYRSEGQHKTNVEEIVQTGSLCENGNIRTVWVGQLE